MRPDSSLPRSPAHLRPILFRLAAARQGNQNHNQVTMAGGGMCLLHQNCKKGLMCIGLPKDIKAWVCVTESKDEQDAMMRA